MIPRANITAWRARAPWPLDEQVEQDLVLSRALADVFSRPLLQEALAFRGGTALHKLYFDPPGRYSEDLDPVQVQAGPIGPLLVEARAALDPWLGEPTWRQNADSVKLLYRFESTGVPVLRMRVKVEINTREHFSVDGLQHVPFRVENPWHNAACQVTTYTPEEILATKMRALYQRKKGRDLYDLHLGLTTLDVNDRHVVECLTKYLERAGMRISRAQFEANLSDKLRSAGFRNDIQPLLRDGAGYDVDAAAEVVRQRLIWHLSGEQWRGGGGAISE
ncbi:MAG: nucleotidyl transferase AbiEii/AbiGii toxin family protein [Coriobacteriia bacterium]|nr:nucleotidyl transferase AbiEii/AbiGii toxin family protein [Coriobacteriia bacterium]